MDKVGICNMAIGHLGISQFISDFDTELSNEARVCRIFYDQARDRVLEEMPWHFAKSYVALQDIGSPPSKWLYRYRYPLNCVFVRSVTPQGLEPEISSYFDFATYKYLKRDQFEIIEDEANGGLAICCNIPSAMICYTARIKSVALYTALFIDAFSWTLGSDIAAPLSAVPAMAEKCAQAYTQSLLKAAARMMNEGNENLERESEFISARY